MKDRILAGFFSVSGVALMVGTAGFLSALVTMFVDVNAAVPVKALLCTVLVATSACVVLLKVIYDLANEKAAAAPFEHPIKYISDERILVIRRNENFLNNIIVGCYSHQEEIERLPMKYLISFPAPAMNVATEDLPAVSEASRSVIREAKKAGVYVFGGGINETAATLMVAPDGAVTNDTYPQMKEFSGGFCVLELPSREAAIRWAAKLASACRCPQELREFHYDAES